MKRMFGLLIVAAMAVPASAQIVVNGTKDAGYGAALAVQTVETGFGDNFSELDAGYGLISGGKLNLFIAGNVEANFNKLEIFIDSKPGGQSVFDSSGNDNADRMDGLVFDAGFTADYHIIFRRGTDGGNQKVDVDFANLLAQSASSYSDVMTGSGLDGVGATGTGVNATAIQVGYDNSNVAGIGGTAGVMADQTAAAAVTTGLELSIDLADLGYAGGVINVMVGQNGGGHDYWSNQFLGGLPVGSGNLGGDGAGNFTGEGAIDFTLFEGSQYFRVVPEPASAGLLGVAGLGWAALSRRRQGRT